MTDPRALLLALTALVAQPPAIAAEVEWPAHGGAPGGGHYSPADQVNRGNVARLELAWAHRSGNFRAGRSSLGEAVESDQLTTRPTSFVGPPIMGQGTLYYCTSFNRVFTLDPATGKQRWVFDPGVDMSNESITNCRQYVVTAAGGHFKTPLPAADHVLAFALPER